MFTKSRKFTKKKIVQDIPRGCIECNGDLLAHDEIYTLTFLGKELFSIGKTRSHVYICDSCNGTFLPSVKYHSFLTDDEKSAAVDSNNSIYARLMVASLAYTANVDGLLSKKEDEFLQIALKEVDDFPGAKMILAKVIDLGKRADQYVFSMFDFAKQHLSRQRLESIIVANARMILVDGRIKKSEKKLLKKYMKVSGVKRSLQMILAKAHKEQYDQ